MFLNSAASATVPAAAVIALPYAGRTIRRLRVRLARLRYAASHAPLTALPVHAQWLTGRRAAHQPPTVVALLDLDGFKQANDTHGHQLGDPPLAAAAEPLSTAVNRHGGHATRLAGDQLLLLPPVGTGDPVQPVGAVLAETTTPVPLGPAGVHTPRPSAGITIFDGIRGTWTTLLPRADIACYHANTGSSNEMFSPGMGMPRPAAPALQRPRRRLRDPHQQACA